MYILQLVEDKLRTFNTISITPRVPLPTEQRYKTLRNISHKKYFLQLIRV